MNPGIANHMNFELLPIHHRRPVTKLLGGNLAAAWFSVGVRKPTLIEVRMYPTSKLKLIILILPSPNPQPWALKPRVILASRP